LFKGDIEKIAKNLYDDEPIKPYLPEEKLKFRQALEKKRNGGEEFKSIPMEDEAVDFVEVKQTKQASK
jgi:hypothetical protein